MMSVEETTRNCSAGCEPKKTELAPVKFVPIKLTEVSPPSGPATGLTAVTTGVVS